MADNGRLTAEQKAKVVLFIAEKKSDTVTQRCFHVYFGTRWAPAEQTMRILKTQFEEEGSVLERKRPRAPSVRTLENMEVLRVAMQRSPSKSTRTASVELGISQPSVQRILHSDLHMFPYNITVMHKLADCDKEQRLYFATWARHEEGILHNTCFSDEAHFHLDGAVNKQNV
jgi:hypothetical protein